MIKKIIPTCNRCGSKDIETNEEKYNRQYRTVINSKTLIRSTRVKSVDIKLVCHCNNCGNDFEEELGSQNFDLLPEDVEL